MRVNLSARLARLEGDANRVGTRFTVSSRVLPDDKWQADYGGGSASAEDGEPDRIMSEDEWVAAYCDPSDHGQKQ